MSGVSSCPAASEIGSSIVVRRSRCRHPIARRGRCRCCLCARNRGVGDRTRVFVLRVPFPHGRRTVHRRRNIPTSPGIPPGKSMIRARTLYPFGWSSSGLIKRSATAVILSFWADRKDTKGAGLMDLRPTPVRAWAALQVPSLIEVNSGPAQRRSTTLRQRSPSRENRGPGCGGSQALLRQAGRRAEARQPQAGPRAGGRTEAGAPQLRNRLQRWMISRATLPRYSSADPRLCERRLCRRMRRARRSSAVVSGGWHRKLVSLQLPATGGRLPLATATRPETGDHG